jgi:hypothetical protein
MPHITGDCVCGHNKDVHFDDRDGMITNGACESGRWTGVQCQCKSYQKQGPMIRLPEGWESWKMLSLLEPELITDPLYFDEDLFFLKSSDGRFILDVGWYGGDAQTGSYKCYLVEMRPDLSEDEYHPWDDALETFSTRKTSEVLQWLSRTLSDVHAKHYSAPKETAAQVESFLFQHYEESMLKGHGTHSEYVIINDISDEVAVVLKTKFESKHNTRVR